MPHDWRSSYERGDTPWDLGRAHPELEERLARAEVLPAGRLRGARALVPGCGRGWDALALARAGMQVSAVDLVGELAPTVEAALAPLGGRFLAGDALGIEDEAGFDLLWEHTFFCAIEPELRPRYGELARRVLRPGARLAALAFPVGKAPELGGPPFGISAAELARALGPAFRLLADEPVRRRVSRRTFEERFLLFERER